MSFVFRAEQAELEKRLKDLESKVIVGGINLVINQFIMINNYMYSCRHYMYVLVLDAK